MIALNEMGVRQRRGALRTTTFTQRIEINRFIRDQLGKIGVAKY
jgi:hypothetical protein